MTSGFTEELGDLKECLVNELDRKFKQLAEQGALQTNELHRVIKSLEEMQRGSVEESRAQTANLMLLINEKSNVAEANGCSSVLLQDIKQALVRHSSQSVVVHVHTSSPASSLPMRSVRAIPNSETMKQLTFEQFFKLIATFNLRPTLIDWLSKYRVTGRMICDQPIWDELYNCGTFLPFELDNFRTLLLDSSESNIAAILRPLLHGPITEAGSAALSRPDKSLQGLTVATGTSPTAHQGGPVPTSTSRHKIPLRLASKQEVQEIVTAALRGHTSKLQETRNQLGIDINSALDQFGSTPLHHAASNGHTETCSYLISNGCKPTSENRSKESPLHCAASNGRFETCKYLLSAGADVNAVTDQGETALYRAAARKQPHICTLLLASGANPNIAGSGSVAPLHVAASLGERGICEQLISAGANVNAETIQRKTPLQLAIQQGKMEAGELLKSKGAQ